MTKRLNTIIHLVPSGRGVIDVGTDHGYVPVGLAQSGYIGNITATDINMEPLKSAIRYAGECGLTERIDFRLTNGLRGCGIGDADTVIVAGMGGDLICSILDEADWIRGREVLLILQPMTRAEILRYYLVSNGWRITGEYPVYENGRLFSLFTARYQGIFVRFPDYRDPGLQDWELFTGRYELIRKSEWCRQILSGETLKISKKLHGKDRLFYAGILEDLESALAGCEKPDKAVMQ